MKAGQTKTVRIGRHDITLLNPGVRWVLDTQKRCRDETGAFDAVAYTEAILEHCVVSPRGLTLDSFDHEEEVLELLRSFRAFRRPGVEVAPGGSQDSGSKGS
jgi:hypothetical protein